MIRRIFAILFALASTTGVARQPVPHPLDAGNALLGPAPWLDPAAPPSAPAPETLPKVVSPVPPIDTSDRAAVVAADNQEQAAALIMAANSTPSHTRPNTLLCGTQAGYDGASTSNLALGTGLTDAIPLYMSDPGAGNQVVGHRRWVLHSRKRRGADRSVRVRPGHHAESGRLHRHRARAGRLRRCRHRGGLRAVVLAFRLT